VEESENPELGSSLFNLFRIDKWRRQVCSKEVKTQQVSVPASPSKCHSILNNPEKQHFMKNKDFFTIRRNTMDCRYKKSPTVDHSKKGRLLRKSMGHGWLKNSNNGENSDDISINCVGNYVHKKKCDILKARVDRSIGTHKTDKERLLVGVRPKEANLRKRIIEKNETQMPQDMYEINYHTSQVKYKQKLEDVL
jgi:ribonuclease I